MKKLLGVLMVFGMAAETAVAYDPWADPQCDDGQLSIYYIDPHAAMAWGPNYMTYLECFDIGPRAPVTRTNIVQDR